MESIQPVPIARICWLRSSPGTLAAAQERERGTEEAMCLWLGTSIAGNRFNRKRAEGAGVGLKFQVGSETKRKTKRA